MPLEIDLFSAPKGAVTAPAGCGKTQLITDTLKAITPEKPVLVLTHTNAGKSALESRLTKAKVPKTNYRVATIDSWAIRMISRFPLRSGHDSALVRLENPRNDYPAIRVSAAELLKSGDVSDALKATYSSLIVDEYQDCSLQQHRIVGWASKVLPTYVLGDPLQSIFDFIEPTVHWDDHVLRLFPSLGTLDTPWRWKRAGAEPLGQWLLSIREELNAGRPIDLSDAPSQVTWIELPARPTDAETVRLEAAQTKGDSAEDSVLVIGDSTSPQGQRFIASVTPGATAVEAVDLRDLTSFGQTFNPTAANALDKLLAFSSEMMTSLGIAELRNRLEILAAGREKKGATPSEAAVLAFMAEPSIGTALDVLTAFEEKEGARVFRPEVLTVCKAAMESAKLGEVNFYEAVVAARERNRHRGRPVTSRAVGSTLLLKGLEADVAVVLNPAAMNARNLYVAMTRGAKKLVICSQTSVLNPRR